MKTLKKLLRVFVILIVMTNELCAQSILAVSNNCAGATVQPISADGAGQSSGTTFGSNLELGESIACAPAGTNQSVWWSFITPSIGSLVPLVVNIVENPPNANPCSGASYNCCPITTVVWESIAGGCPMTDPCKMVSCQSSVNGPQTPFGGGGNPALTRRHRHQLGLNELLPNTKYYVQVLYSTSCSQRALFNYWVSNSATYVDITNPTANSTCTSLGLNLCNIVSPTQPTGATIVSNCNTIGNLPRDTVNTVIRECFPFNSNGNTTINFSNYIGSNCAGLDGNWDTTKNVNFGYWKLMDINCNTLVCNYIGGQTITSIAGLVCYTDYILCFQYEIKNCTHSTHTPYIFAPNIDCTPLPVELVDFDAEYTKKKTVALSWRTLSEKNNMYFIIERSMDALKFVSIGKVPGFGDSNVGINYQSYDNSPLSGTSYYRLKQVDFDGMYKYSKIRAVNIDDDGISIFPNPADEVLSVKTSHSTEFVMTNAVGQVVMHTFIKQGLNEINVSQIKNGIYFITVSNKNQKVLIVH